jgi:predicted PurR-regulated permease PerM
VDHVPATDPITPTSGPTTTTGDAATGLPFWLRWLGAFSWRMLVIIALVATLLVLAFVIGVVTASVALAAVTSVAVMPVVQTLRARGWSTTKAAAAGTALVFGTLVLVLAVAAAVLVRYGPDIITAAKAGMDDLHRRETSGQIAPQVADAIASIIDGAKTWVGTNAGMVAGDVSNLASVLLFGAFTTFFALASDLAWWRWLTQNLGEGGRSTASDVAGAGVRRLGAYLGFIAVMGAAEALVSLLLLAILGMPLAIPLATLVFAGAFVPYVGGIVVAIAILLVALSSIGPGGTLLLLILLVVANVILDRVVARPIEQPGSRVNPAIVLIALPIGAYVAGFYGLVMAVPITVLLLAMGSALLIDLRRGSLAEPASGALVPRWLDLLAGWSWRLLAGTALVAVLFIPIVQVPMLSLPLILAAVLAPTFSPAVGALRRRGWGRSRASAVVTAGVAGIIVLLSGVALSALVGNVTNIASNVVDGAGSISDSTGGLGGLLGGLADKLTGDIADIVISVSSAVASFTVVMAVGVILTFIALRDGRSTWDRLTSYMAPWRRVELDAAADRAVSVTGGYMLGTGAISLFGAATQFLLMVILGVPLALPVFVLSLFGGYIPYIGSLLTTGLAFLLTVTTGNPVAIVIMLLFTVIFNVVAGNVIQPIVLSKAVNIHPAVVLLAIPAGGALAGIMGMFLIVPVIGVVATTWRSALKVMGQPPAGTLAADMAPAPAPGPVTTTVDAAPAPNPA